MKVIITSIGVYSLGRLFGARNYVLFNLMAKTKDRSLIQRIELGLINSLHQFIVVASKSQFLVLIYYCFIRIFNLYISDYATRLHNFFQQKRFVSITFTLYYLSLLLVTYLSCHMDLCFIQERVKCSRIKLKTYEKFSDVSCLYNLNI